ncbi:hypothetical protein GCM10007350_25930 [Jeongeupia chitinilytica]|uniref:DUF3302 domain-containing protein n=1 Tax=Jeongeupia chitinilytica TaxID=1041641 RepID=A0ABQ3H1B7_9NEIS|nr:hypothetical protein GCM10007350_25930 [Jeongeupia chitinilytica]
MGAGVLLALPAIGHASFLHGDALDTAADVLSWIVLILVPVIGIYLFWMVHILPEKIAHQNHHPQKEAIHMLCLLSLVFGGLLWPFAFLWAKTKPVMYKRAYGTDKHPDALVAEDLVDEVHRDSDEIARLRAELEELKKQTGNGAA